MPEISASACAAGESHIASHPASAAPAPTPLRNSLIDPPDHPPPPPPQHPSFPPLTRRQLMSLPDTGFIIRPNPASRHRGRLRLHGTPENDILRRTAATLKERRMFRTVSADKSR